MDIRKSHHLGSRAVSILLTGLLLLAFANADVTALAQTPARTPTEAVREFYKALRERRFREAFAMSIYKPAVEGLSAADFEELRPDFEKMAAAVPEKVEISGEQISGDTATVFMKTSGDDAAAKSEPITLLRAGNAWIIGDRENEAVVRASGKQFFFKARIDAHHGEAQTMLQRISAAQIIYHSQHGGRFADLPTLINAGLVPKDVETADSTGYRFHITLGKDGKSFVAGAEPARYGRTGRLSFYMDLSGIKSKDTGGKPYNPPSEKK